MKYLPLLFAVIALPLPSHAGDDYSKRYFEHRDREGLHTLALQIDGDQVFGRQEWRPKERDGAYGTIEGRIEEGLLTAVYSYTIEGSEQTEEQVFRFEPEGLVMGRGELEDPKFDGNMVLKDPSKLKFDTRFKEVKVTEPAPGSAERKAIMDALRGPVSQQIGKPVIFTGSISMIDGWATFSGNADPRDGKVPADLDAQFDLDLDLFGLLKKEEGQWVVKYHGFSGDIGAMEEAAVENPDAHWALFQ